MYAPSNTAPLTGANRLASRCLVAEGLAVTPDATEALVGRWARDVLRWCRFLCDARVHPEDACQDVLAVLATRTPELTDAAEVRRWLWGVTWRTVRAHKRRAWVRGWLPGSGAAGWLEQLPARPGPSDTDRAVKAVLARLKPEHQRLLWLAYAEGATRPELAAHLGLAEGSLNRKLAAARQAFDAEARRAGLAPGGDDE